MKSRINIQISCVVAVSHATHFVLLYFVLLPKPSGVADATATTSGNTDPVLSGLVVTLGVTTHRVVDSSLLLVVGSRVGTLLAQGAVQLVAVVGVDTVLVAPPVVLQLDLRWRWGSLGSIVGSSRIVCTTLSNNFTY